jgi:hypothetical protein
MLNVYQVEIDKRLERCLELCRIEVTCRLGRARGVKPWARNSRSEEPGRTTHESHDGAHLIGKTARRISARQQ